ncbi:hypothetical protein WOLCODRAFT_166136 [Wolfiporia cocos MD-104 SS10]|uniref:WW domain-containing protein n=1 Tax=Wolfiporia cocos (strain MD-104) TaxID=742152 RepID=A0A2H3JGV0_WOLCO|nr:hypothetical protein WOLCODRAFT_166136 [Wolfiporia cocos MD-104 SS10]
MILIYWRAYSRTLPRCSWPSDTTRGREYQGEMSKSNPSSIVLSRLTGLSSRGNWVHVEHPEGQPYFIKKTETGAHLYTDMWLYDVQKLENAEKYSQRISQALGAQDHTDTDIVIDIRRDSEDDTEPRCFYYLASRSQRSIFWLRDVPVDLISQNARPVYDERYLKNASLAQYWIHIQMFPNDRTVSEQLLRESSTSPYGPDDLSNLSKVLKVVQKEINIVDESSMFILARTLSIFYWERFIHFHGQPEARLDREQPIFDDTEHQRSWLLALVSPLLFYLPDQYMGELKKLWVEQTVNYRPWMAFVAGLRNDWESSILPATVLLSANVGLLAVNSIDSEHRNRSVAQVASYISTFFSLGNIILCTIFARQHRPRAHDSAELASDYLDRRSTVIAGLEPLAIAFSLPSALFIWGMVAFTVAMAWVGLNASTVQTRVWTGLFLGIITVLIAAVLWVEVWPVPSLEWLSRYVPPPPWHTIRLPRFRLSARSSQPLGDQSDVEFQARSFE